MTLFVNTVAVHLFPDPVPVPPWDSNSWYREFKLNWVWFEMELRLRTLLEGPVLVELCVANAPFLFPLRQKVF